MPGELIVEAQAVFAASAPQNTAFDIDVSSRSEADPGSPPEYEVTVRNPSAVTALTVHVKSLEAADATFGGGAARYPELATFSVPASTPEGKTFAVVGWDLAGQPGRVTLTNDTALGVGQGFTADLRVRKI